MFGRTPAIDDTAFINAEKKLRVTKIKFGHEDVINISDITYQQQKRNISRCSFFMKIISDALNLYYLILYIINIIKLYHDMNMSFQ